MFEYWHFPPIFFLIKIDLPGNTVWPQASGFQKLVKRTILGDSKCKRNSLRSQYWMRLFLWFSNTVKLYSKKAFRPDEFFTWFSNLSTSLAFIVWNVQNLFGIFSLSSFHKSCGIVLGKRMYFWFWHTDEIDMLNWRKWSRTFSQCLKITEKVAFNIASEASIVLTLSGKSSLKMPKITIFENL